MMLPSTSVAPGGDLSRTLPAGHHLYPPYALCSSFGVAWTHRTSLRLALNSPPAVRGLINRSTAQNRRGFLGRFLSPCRGHSRRTASSSTRRLGLHDCQCRPNSVLYLPSESLVALNCGSLRGADRLSSSPYLRVAVVRPCDTTVPNMHISLLPVGEASPDDVQ